MKYFEILEENIETVKKSLISLGYSKEIVDTLEPGYYRYDGVKVKKITKKEFEQKTANSIDLISIGGGVILGGCKMYLTNKELNTSKYGCIDEKTGKWTGFGYAFEDMCNRMLTKAGYHVDSSIGKTNEKGWPDVIITDQEGNKIPAQYKCSTSPKHTAEKIEKRDGYPGQVIITNTELPEPLKKEMNRRKNYVVNERIVDSGISINDAKKVARPGTKESLKFDAETAIPTSFAAAFAAALFAFLKETKKQGCVNKKVIVKTAKYGIGVGIFMFTLHIVFNQITRLK